LGASVSGWACDIKETQGFAPNYPMIADVDYNVSKLYGMLPAAISGDPTKRAPADNQTVRNVCEQQAMSASVSRDRCARSGRFMSASLRKRQTSCAGAK
jgi:hypothetical protein